MTSNRVLIVEENSMVPLDRRVWYEATTLRDAGWQVVVICPGYRDAHVGPGTLKSDDQPEDLDGVTVYRYPLTFAEHGIASYLGEYFSAFVSIARLSWRVWRKGHFDIIHICNPPDIFFPIGLFYRFLGAKFVFDHHDLFSESVAWRYRGLSGRLLYIVARVAEYLTLRSANAVIVTNESYRRIALERTDVSEEKVIVVRNGPKADEFVPLDPVPDLKRGFPYLACFVGLMGEEDGIANLVEIIRHTVCELKRQDILFVLIGDGPERETALDRIQTLGLERFVEMPGLILDDNVLRKYMSTADVFLSPEPWTPMNAKSTFIKIGEYMIMGKPTVAFDLEESRYTAKNAAVLVRPGNIPEFSQAVSDLLDDPERRNRMGKYGQQRARDYLAWEHQSKHLLQVYRMALGQVD